MDANLIAIQERINYLHEYYSYKQHYDELIKKVKELQKTIEARNKLKEDRIISFLRSKNITIDEYKHMDPILAKTIIPNDLILEDIRKQPHQSNYINLLNNIYIYQQKLNDMTITEDDTFEKLKEKEIKILEELTNI